MNKKVIFPLLLIIVPFVHLRLDAQFYNGHKMAFGKSRVQYNDFFWSYYRHSKFDVYFNQDGEQLANYVSIYAAKKIPEIESFFEFTLDSRVIFLVYNKLTDFRQSNIDLVTGSDTYNTGGTTTISRNKVFLYFEGDYAHFELQINAAIARVILNEMLYGSQLTQNVSSSALLTLPEWYSEGLISYISERWSIDIENMVKDGIVNERFEKFNKLTGPDAVIAGHSFWRFLAVTYGESVIPNIIYLTRINKNVKSGFLYVLGMNLKQLSYEWTGYYLDLFSEDRNSMQVPETGAIVKRPKRDRVYYGARIERSGRYIAYVTNDFGRYRLWLYDEETQKRRVIFRKEHKLQQITDYSYPIMAWHPNGHLLSFVTEEKGGLKIYYYNTETRERMVRNLLYFDKILSFAFSDDGSRLAFSAVYNGKSDIFIHTLASGTNLQVTNDVADDLNPRFINNSTQLIFSSNRTSDTLSIEQTAKHPGLVHHLFIYDLLSRPGVLVRLNDDRFVNKNHPVQADDNIFLQLSDHTGIVNRHKTIFDSTISHIDTTIHYRYIANSVPLTTYSRNIHFHDYAPEPGTVVEGFYNQGRYRLFRGPVLLNEPLEEIPAQTPFRLEQTRRLKLEDSLRSHPVRVVNIRELIGNQVVSDQNDTIYLGDYTIEVGNYVFEREKINMYNEQLKGKGIRLRYGPSEEQMPKARIYRTAFYQNYLVSQVDFSFLNESYQVFTGGAFYFNPGMNVLLKLGTNDLFEDYKVTGGFRLSPDFDSNEYLVSFENLKRRLDKSVIFHRQAYKNIVTDQQTDIDYLIKLHSHTLSSVFKYPFTQVMSGSATVSYRNDRVAYLSYDPNSLARANEFKNWAGIKLEHVFDNTFHIGTNLYSGMRYKLFAEFYQQLSGNLDDMVILGADLRHYLKLHRTLIWANRVAGSTSQGSSKLIYYLGGVDNWININQRRNPTFIPFDEVRINTEENYVYQAVGTNMRGFSQNIRNGNNFALFNSEIRWPVFRYFANYPISSSFIQNFQVVGFFDYGTAWSGPTPWSKKNAYDFVEILGNPINITIDLNRKPFVAGYGFGLRSQLLGYFVRLDWAWGIDDYKILQRVFYLSLSLDF